MDDSYVRLPASLVADQARHQLEALKLYRDSEWSRLIQEFIEDDKRSRERSWWSFWLKPMTPEEARKAILYNYRSPDWQYETTEKQLRRLLTLAESAITDPMLYISNSDVVALRRRFT